MFIKQHCYQSDLLRDIFCLFVLVYRALVLRVFFSFLLNSGLFSSRIFKATLGLVKQFNKLKSEVFGATQTSNTIYQRHGTFQKCTAAQVLSW